MLQALIDWLSGSFYQLIPLFVVADYEKAIVLRCGKFTKECQPGLHFKFPLLDVVHKTNITYDAGRLTTQYLTTADGVPVCLELYVGFTVSDVRTFFLEVEDAESVLVNCVSNTAASLVVENGYAYFMSHLFNSDLKEESQDEAEAFGICVEDVGVLSRFKFDRMFLTRTE